MSQIIQSILNLFRHHKLKIAASVASFVIGLFLFFPFGDLGDYATVKVSELTANQVFLQFSDLGMSLFPQPGLEFMEVTVDTPFTPTLKAGSIAIAPSIAGLLTFKPGVAIRAEQFMGGALSLSTRGGEKTSGGNVKQIVAVGLEKMDLKTLIQLAQSPIVPTGKISGDVDVDVDPSFAEQPSGTIQFSGSDVKLAAASLTTPIGPLPLPELAAKSLELKGQIKKGKITLEKFRLGEGADELLAQVTGQIDLRLGLGGPDGFSAIPGAFDFTVELKAKPAFVEKAGLFLSFLDSYKKPGGIGGTTDFAFRISGTSFAVPPKITAVQ